MHPQKGNILVEPSHDSSDSLLDYEPAQDVFLADVVAGLSAEPKRLPCKYFYDETGSKLFERICELPEYYPTRTELKIMRSQAESMARHIGPRAMLVEFGSGSSIKTRTLLDHLHEPAAYVPVDISRQHLQESADRLSARYPDVDVLPVCADFTAPFELPEPPTEAEKIVVYFPGSTIGNFERAEAQRLLASMADLCDPSGGVLIGIDLQKEPEVIEAAYNDSQGVTAKFNLNLLRRINTELGADFDLEAFRHRAVYNAAAGRMEIFLVSRPDQVVHLAERKFTFAAGEAICTEYSHKYTPAGFAQMASSASLTLQRTWTDSQHWFAVLYLQAE